jgi:hypothetical protein
LLLQELSADQALALAILRRSAQERMRHAPRTPIVMTATTAATDFNALRVSVHREMSSAEPTTRTRHRHRMSRLVLTAAFCLARLLVMVSVCSEIRTSSTVPLVVAVEVNARTETARVLQHGKRSRIGSRTTRTSHSLWELSLPHSSSWLYLAAVSAVFAVAWPVARLQSDQP